MSSVQQELMALDGLQPSNLTIRTSTISIPSDKLNINVKFIRSSSIKVIGEKDDRLINLVKSIDKNGTYLSGKGGRFS